MKLKEIKELLNAQIMTGDCDEDTDIDHIFASDFMSDVLAYANNEALLITGLNNPQVIRTAEMMDMAAVLFVRGKQPNIETLDLAIEKSVILMVTEYIMFEACGILYKCGMKGSEKI